MYTDESFDEKGKPVNKEYLELNLPPYLQRDLDALKQGYIDNPPHLDCLQDEVYGSINGAFWDGVITEEQANYLREEYL